MKKIEFWAGTIKSAISEAIAKAGELGELVEFDFNGVTVQVAANSDATLIYRDWSRGMMRPSGTFTVEPHPAAELSREQVSEDARLQEEIEQRRRAAQIEYEQRQRNAQALLDGALSVAPPIALRDAPAWQQAVEINSHDGYSSGVMQFAEAWARLMQLKISQGATVADCADECCSVADGPIGITGFMYGCAVGVLSQTWIHGEELRRWHNLKTQHRNEGEQANEDGGVLNPAILVLV